MVFYNFCLLLLIFYFESQRAYLGFLSIFLFLFYCTYIKLYYMKSQFSVSLIYPQRAIASFIIPHTYDLCGIYCFEIVRPSVSFFISAQYLIEEHFNGFWPNFAHALKLTRSSLGLLCINFCQFV